MHTVRNRVASKPRPMGKAKHAVNRKRREPAFMLKACHPPAFPAGLIVPLPRGAVIAAVPWPAPASVEGDLITLPAKPARKTSVSRKAAPRKEGKPRKCTARKRAAQHKQKPKPKRKVAIVAPEKQEAAVPMITADLLDRALAMQATPVEPAVTVVPPTPSPAAVPTPAAGVTAIPRSRSLAQHRSTALFDVIGYWLRDAGRWLARWGLARRKAEARVQFARANARLRAMQLQVEALEALREVAGAE